MVERRWRLRTAHDPKRITAATPPDRPDAVQQHAERQHRLHTPGVRVAVAVYRALRGGSAGTTTSAGPGTTTPASSGATPPRNPFPTKVVQASTTTNASGAWSLSLSPFAVGDDRDLIKVDVTGAPLLPDFITTGNGGNPFTESGWTGWIDLNIGADVSNRKGGFVTLGPCFQTGVLTLRVGSTSYPANDTCNTQTDTATIATGPISTGEAVTMSSNENRAFTEPQAVGPSLDRKGNEAGALVNLSVELGEPGAQSIYTSPLADVLPLMRPTGFATCTADRAVRGRPLLRPVARRRLSLTRARGADKLSATADNTGTIVVGPFRGAPSLTGGDVLTLRNRHRVLTRLHVAHLVAVIDGEQTVLGPGSRCQPGLYYGAPPSILPISSAAGLTGQNGATLTGRICPLSGSAEGLPVRAIEQADDRSGGFAETDVAHIASTSPVDGETLYGRFTGARGRPPRVQRRVIPSAYPVSLIITRANGTKPVVELSSTSTPRGHPGQQPEAGDL